MINRFSITALLLFLLALPASAQLVDDRVPRERTIPLRIQVQNELASYRNHLGPVRLFPRVELRNFGYNDNVFGATEESEQVSDYTASVAAGTRYLLPFGRKLFLRGDLMPEYTYYHDLEQNRSFGGLYDASLLGLFNRFSLEATGSLDDRVQLVNTETERPAVVRTERGELRGEVDLGARFSVFGSGVQADRRFDTEDELGEETSDFEELERTDRAVRGGIRYKFASFFDMTALVERTDSEFVVEPQERDNETEAILLGLHYDRPQMFVSLSIGQREGKPANGSNFPEFSTPTGSYYLNYEFGRPIVFEAYGNRGMIPGTFVNNPYFLETRSGLGLKYRLGERLILRAHGEIGSNQYPRSVLVGGVQRIERQDEVSAYGIGLAIRLYRRAALEVNASNTEYDSNIPGFDRSVFRVTSGLTLRGDFLR